MSSDIDTAKIIRQPTGRARFIIIFLLVVGGYFGLAAVPWVDQEFVFPVLKFSARGATGLLTLAGFDVQNEGVLVKGGGYSVAVHSGCDPLGPIALMVGAMLGFPADWRRRWAGMLVGTVILFGLNLVRIASLFLTGRAHSSWFYSLHQEWWPGFFIVVALLMWWAWLNWVGRVERGEERRA